MTESCELSQIIHNVTCNYIFISICHRLESWVWKALSMPWKIGEANFHGKVKKMHRTVSWPNRWWFGHFMVSAFWTLTTATNHHESRVTIVFPPAPATALRLKNIQTALQCSEVLQARLWRFFSFGAGWRSAATARHKRWISCTTCVILQGLLSPRLSL